MKQRKGTNYAVLNLHSASKYLLPCLSSCIIYFCSLTLMLLHFDSQIAMTAACAVWVGCRIAPWSPRCSVSLALPSSVVVDTRPSQRQRDSSRLTLPVTSRTTSPSPTCEWEILPSPSLEWHLFKLCDFLGCSLQNV